MSWRLKLINYTIELIGYLWEKIKFKNEKIITLIEIFNLSIIIIYELTNKPLEIYLLLCNNV